MSAPRESMPRPSDDLASDFGVEDDEDLDVETPPLAIPSGLRTAPPLAPTPQGSYAQEGVVSRPGRLYMPPSPRYSDVSEELESDLDADENAGLLSSTSPYRQRGGYPPSNARTAPLSVPFLDPPPGQTPSRAYIRAVTVVSTLGVYFALTLLLSLLVLELDSKSDGGASIVYAGILGLISTAFSTVQFLPQIVHTWREGKVGALSIPTLAMQAPGSFLFVYSLMLQPGTNM